MIRSDFRPSNFRLRSSGGAWVFLDWREPVVGGAGAAYILQRRLHPDGPWADAGIAVKCEATLTNQERSKEWEHRVLAVNNASQDQPSNTDMAVL